VDSTDTVQHRLPGAILAAERERQGLSPTDIAQRLHMSVWQVEALEAGNYARLPSGTFLRGFVRNYAKVVGLPPQEVLARLAEAAPSHPAPHIVVPTQNIRFEPLSDRMSSPYVRAAGLSALVIVLGFAALYWWVFVRSASHLAVVRKPAEAVPAPAVAAIAPPVTAKPAAAPPETVPPVAAPPVTQPPTPPAVTPAATTRPEPKTSAIASSPASPPRMAAPVPTQPRPDAPPAAVPVAVTEQGGVIKLRFKGRSWVEVRDARGKVLLNGLNEAGSEAEVAGRPPFKVVVGNAPEVRLFFNDRELNLEPHMREAVARVTVE